MPESMPLGMIGGSLRSKDLKGMGVWGKGVAEAKGYIPDAGKHAVRHDWRFYKVVRSKRDMGFGGGESLFSIYRLT